MLGYELVFPTPEQLVVRRKQLERAGFYAYISPLILLLTVFAYRTLRHTLSQPSSTGHRPSIFLSYSRKASWILNTTYVSEFGPLKVQLLGLGYTVLLLSLIIRGTGNDYMHLTKAFGHIAASQLPVQYLLSFKSPNSPITLATGLAHERLNAYHRLFGRIIHGIFAAHAVLYLRAFVELNVLAKRLGDWDVRYGLMIFWSMNFLGLLAIPPIRQKLYHKVFYRSHIFFSAALLVALWLHVPYTRVYVAQAGVFWVLNGVLRKSNSVATTAKCEIVGKDLIKVILKAPITKSDLYISGSHVYINSGVIGPRTPFTVVNIERGDSSNEFEMALIAKNSYGPQTDLLAISASSARPVTVNLEGPYGEAGEYMPGLLNTKSKRSNFLIVAGGVGMTYALSVYMALANAHGHSASIKLVWVVRNISDTIWIRDYLHNDKSMYNSILMIYATQKTTNATDDSPTSLCAAEFGKRPDFERIVDDFFVPKADRNGNANKTDPRRMKRDYEPVAVLSCGPASMTRDLRKAVGRHVFKYGREVMWHEEQFGFGGL